MTLYRVRIKLCSAIATPLKGDTIWGHIVWGIANHEGSEKVREFLEQEKSASPALVVSSAFPAGMLCRPLPPPGARSAGLNRDSYSEIKKNKKMKYVPAAEYVSCTETGDGVDENPFKSAHVLHNTIDRVGNTVMAGGLYSNEELWPVVSEWDIYIASSEKTDRIKELVGWAFENGYGADASTGKGKIEMISGPDPVQPKKDGKTYMALGPFVDAKNGISDLRADTFVRSGKLGGAFASSLPPFKKPVVLYDEGAVFTCATPIPYTGMLLENMHSSTEFTICQSGFAPVLPIAQKE